MAFRKTVLAKAADLLEHPLGKLSRNSLRLHARDQPLAVALHPSGAMPRRHIAPQLIGLARRVIRHHHGKPHHLLLE